MAYDEDLADRIREIVQDETALSEKRMFGGLAFLVAGHLAVAASGSGGLMVRVDPTASAGLVDDLHVRRVEMRGKEMDGWLRIDDATVEDDSELRRWIGVGLERARALPPK